MTDATLDPSLTSWVPVPAGSDFPVQNLPYGVFETSERPPRVGVAIGDHILDLAAVHADGHLPVGGLVAGILERSVLNDFMQAGPTVWRETRRRVSRLLTADDTLRPEPARYLVRRADTRLRLPIEVGDYVDFYSSLHHATNVGRMFRPGDPPLLANWRHLPVAYHGRSSTVVASGTPVVRPCGQRPGPEGPTFGPSTRLDFELEVGFLTGLGNERGRPIPVGEAEGHIFGLCLVNDWSARDIQAWEYRPLGPFTAKSFATTISPWIVTLDALAPFRVPPPPQDPEPLPYLRSLGDAAIDLRLTVELNGEVISDVGFRDMYWTMSQQLAHATVNGTNVRPGDLYASGTVSGDHPGALGSLLELTWNGTRPVQSTSGPRTFLEDGDTVVMRGRCERTGSPGIGFGECAGTVVPALVPQESAL